VNFFLRIDAVREIYIYIAKPVVCGALPGPVSPLPHRKIFFRLGRIPAWGEFLRCLAPALLRRSPELARAKKSSVSLCARRSTPIRL
jgi:hypothetical protein